MFGLMMDQPLLISHLLEFAARNHQDTEIVSRRVEGDIHRYTYADAAKRARRLAQALTRAGVASGERIATLAWNGYRHYEIYYGVSGMGAVCHTVNPRLFPDQIVYILNHAQASMLFFDATFLPLVEAVADKLESVKRLVILADKVPATKLARLEAYEELLARESGDYTWPVFDERTASSLCYTSGTTGHPKGALYSHRSTILHAYASAHPDALGMSSRDTVCPVVPMFHVNAWGLPYSATLSGCKFVFPGAALDGKSLYELFESEGVVFSAGVPTIWMSLLNHVRQNNLRFSTLRSLVVGGSAAPPAMIEAFRALGVDLRHAWGMTELSPLGTVNTLLSKHARLALDTQHAMRAKQGRALFGIDLEIIGADGKALPHDGVAFGDLIVRGPWVCSNYFKLEHSDSHVSVNGETWFKTGDVATIDADGFMQITDRSKDVIKSGGEWISSIDLENIAVAHPAIAEAAVIGVAHPKWDERPLVIAVKKKDADVTRDELLRFYEGKIAKWQIPDDVVFVEQLPHTATGKLLKTKLREEFQHHKLPAG